MNKIHNRWKQLSELSVYVVLCKTGMPFYVAFAYRRGKLLIGRTAGAPGFEILVQSRQLQIELNEKKFAKVSRHWNKLRIGKPVKTDSLTIQISPESLCIPATSDLDSDY